MAIKLVGYDVWRTLLLPNKAYTKARAELILRTAGWTGDPAEGAAIIKSASAALDQDMNTSGIQYGFEPRVQAALRDLGLPPLSDNRLRTLAEEALQLHLHMPPTLTDPDLPAVFAALQEVGIGVAVGSNTGFTNGQVVSAILPALGLRPDYEVYSDELGIAKPDPDIFRHLLRIAGCRPAQAAFIGDTYSADVEGPLALGMNGLHYTPDGTTSLTTISRHRDLLAHPVVAAAGVKPLTV